MVLIIDERVEKFTESLKKVDMARVSGYVRLFKEYGFKLPTKYLKKVNKNLWELRPGNIRLLLGRVKTDIIVINSFVKKTDKTPEKEIKTANSRLKEYEK